MLLEKIAHTENSFSPHMLSYEQYPLFFINFFFNLLLHYQKGFMELSFPIKESNSFQPDILQAKKHPYIIILDTWS